MHKQSCGIVKKMAHGVILAVLIQNRPLFAASLGFLLNLLAFAVIKLTGSVTQKVLGTVKNVLLVIFSVMFMGEQVSWRQWLGATPNLRRLLSTTSLTGFWSLFHAPG